MRSVPLHIIGNLYYPAPSGKTGRALLVMLPGIGMAADEFATHGFVSAVHDRRLPINMVVARPELGLYLEAKVAGSLHRSVIAPAMARGYRRLWLLGISGGGMGAVLYTAARFAPVDGLVLLAPFLGTPGTLAEVAGVGGITAWSPQNSGATAVERQMLLWLQSFLTSSPARPALYLGFGRHDRFAVGHGLLARHLPQNRVVVSEGGHDWPSWTALWLKMLERQLFSAEIRNEY